MPNTNRLNHKLHASPVVMDGDDYVIKELHVGPHTITQWIREGVALGAHALFVVWDVAYPPSSRAVFVMPGENIQKRFAALDTAQWQHVAEVHLLSQN
jgi:hypothetical protein